MRLDALAEALGLPTPMEPARQVEGIATLDAARSHELAFAAGERYREALAGTGAGAVITSPALASASPVPVLVSDDPYAAYARASWLFAPAVERAAGIDATARVHDEARLATHVSIGAMATIGPRTLIGAGATIGNGCHIGADCRIGERTRLAAGVVVRDGCVIGADGVIQSGAVIGGDGFGFAPTDAGWIPIRQAGGVRIGNRVHIGANTTIDRGAIDDTVLGDGVIVDNLVQIAHNVEIGENTAIAGCTGIAGSTRIGRDCMIGGACNIVGHLVIADGVVLNATSTVTRSIEAPGRYGSGVPLLPVARWRRWYATLERLDELWHRLRRLESRD